MPGGPKFFMNFDGKAHKNVLEVFDIHFGVLRFSNAAVPFWIVKGREKAEAWSELVSRFQLFRLAIIFAHPLDYTGTASSLWNSTLQKHSNIVY